MASQVPVFDRKFLNDYTPLGNPFMGRHETGTWEVGTGDVHFFDTITVGQPNMQNRWQRVSAAECENACNPPRVFVGFGSRRDSYFPEQMKLNSQTFCLTQLEHNTRPGEQIAEWMRGAKKMPEMYYNDFLKVHAVDMQTTVQIASDDFRTFTPDITGPVTNITGQLTTIDLGAEANLPESQLTWPYLNYLTTILDLNGYHEAPSGLPCGMFNLITSPRDWFKLTNGMESMKDMMALGNFQAASPLYKVETCGIQKPFGNIAPTLDSHQIRFQHMGNGMLNRVQPYLNQATTTGIEPVYNPAWVNATIGLSYIWHPAAIKLWTKSFTKMHPLVPSINNSMYGTWGFVNDNPIMLPQPDGTMCTAQNNDDHTLFYWKVNLYSAFQYKYRKFLMPILHQIDGSGKCATVNDPICCDNPAYVEQNYSDDPTVCED